MRVQVWSVVLILLNVAPARAQDSIQDLQKEVRELRLETLALRQQVEAMREQLAWAVRPQEIDQRPLEKLEEEQELLNAKVEEHHQTKVESASKYRVQLSGMILTNMFSNRGAVDNLDFPALAVSSPIHSRGSFGGTLRQSSIGLEVFGPDVSGARLSGDIQLDFAGGFPYGPDGVASGLPRLRTGAFRMAWPKTTVVAGQDAPFFSPLSPASIASMAVPALSYSGNLWTWIPQVRVEHRFDMTSTAGMVVQAGILNPLTGELAPPFLRTPQAGEASRQPAYATRVAWNGVASGQPIRVGIGGYYSRQDWAFDRTIDAWAATSDWTVPLSGRWELSGEFYRGRALGGLGGGIGRSALFSGELSDPDSRVRALNSMGGWAQVKFRQTEKFEWNGAWGQDNIRTRDLRAFRSIQDGYVDPSTSRNRSSLLNFIYHPRSDLVLSAEYRRLKTFTIYGKSERAHHLNLSVGVLF